MIPEAVVVRKQKVNDDAYLFSCIALSSDPFSHGSIVRIASTVGTVLCRYLNPFL